MTVRSLWCLVLAVGCSTEPLPVEQSGNWAELMLNPNACVTADISPLTPAGARVPGVIETLIVDLFLDLACASADLVRLDLGVVATDNASSGWNDCGNGLPGGKELADKDKWELWEGGTPGAPVAVSQINDPADLEFRTMPPAFASCDTDSDGDYDAVPLSFARFVLSQGPTGVLNFTSNLEITVKVETFGASAAFDDELTLNAINIVVDSGNGHEFVPSVIPVPGGTLIF